MSTTTKDISAAEWLDVRDSVAAEVKKTSSMQLSSAIGVAERLLRAGYIDIDAAIAKIRPAAISTEEEA